VKRLLEEEYKVIGSHRVLEMLADDLMQLHQEYYPLKDRAEMGDIVWQTTKDDGQRQSYGKRTESYAVQTVLLPLVRKEDIERRVTHKRGKKNEHYVLESERDREQLVRLVKSAKAQGGLLSGAELSVLMNRSLTTIGRLLKEHFRETGEILPMKGYVLDQESNPTHKAIIISLYEQGLSPLAIARKTAHTQSAVDRYLKTYEQVLQLVKKGHNASSICQITGRRMQTVVQYLRLVKEFHPKMKVDVSFKSEQHKMWYHSKNHPK
jgi:DNA-binding NarL/FixJ family response regulator